MIDIRMIGHILADTHNMLNDIEIKGGRNARIVVYAQENMKRIIGDINKELNEHPELYNQDPSPVAIPILNEPSKGVTPNDNPGSIEQH